MTLAVTKEANRSSIKVFSSGNVVARPVLITPYVQGEITSYWFCVSCLSVCKFLTVELQDALEKTGRSKEVLELGEVLDTGKRRRKIQYNTS